MWKWLWILLVPTNMLCMQKKEHDFLKKAYSFLDDTEKRQLSCAIMNLKSNNLQKYKLSNLSMRYYEKEIDRMRPLGNPAFLRAFVPAPTAVLFSYGHFGDEKCGVSVVIAMEQQIFSLDYLYKFLNQKFEASLQPDIESAMFGWEN